MSDAAEICLSGSALPGRLADLRFPPKQLYLRGELPRGPAVAIVGTRSASKEYGDFAFELARDLARAGVAVLSGGAAGIDTQAHLGALEAGGVTVVVAPAGFDRPFPPENAKLFQSVLDHGGAYLSLFEADIPSGRGAFFRRNACLVALAHVVAVVEAGIPSGALNAASHARQLGRPLFVAPVAPWHPRGAGSLAELQRGARFLLTVQNLFDALSAQNLHAVGTPADAQRAQVPQQESFDFTERSPPADARAAVLAAVQHGAGTGDEIGLEVGLPAGRVSELILTMRLEGVLVIDPSGRLKIDKLSI